MGKCIYDDRHAPLVKWLMSNRQIIGKSTIEESLRDSFIDDLKTYFTDDSVNQIINKLDLVIEPKKSVKPVEFDPEKVRYEQEISKESNTLKESYSGTMAQYRRLTTSFTTKLISLVIGRYDAANRKFVLVSQDPESINSDSKATTLNHKIAEMKIELANKLVREYIQDISILRSFDDLCKNSNAGTIDTEFATYIAKVINAVELRANANQEMPFDCYEAFLILKHFDKYLKQEAPFLRINKIFDGREGVNKYEYTGPNMSHYQEYGETDVHANEFDSDVAKLILSIIPADTSKTSSIETHSLFGDYTISPIGMDAFRTICNKAKNELFYGKSRSQEIDDARKRCFNDYMENGCNMNLGELLELIKKTSSASMKDSIRYSDSITYLTQKASAIKEILFNKDNPLPKSITQMLVATFIKSENPNYWAYSTDDDGFKGKNLKENFSKRKQRQLDRMFDASIKLLNQKEFKVKHSEDNTFYTFSHLPGYKISKTEKYVLLERINGDGKVLEALRLDTPTEGNKAYNVEDTKLVYINNGEETVVFGNNAVKKDSTNQDIFLNAEAMIQQACKDFMSKTINIDDYDKLVSKPNSVESASIAWWAQDYSMILMATLATVVDDAGASPYKNTGRFGGTRYTFFASQKSKDMVTLAAESIAIHESIMDNEETRTTVMSPSLKKLPTQTLTCLNYNVRRMIYDHQHKGDASIYSKNPFIINPAALGPSSIRNEVKFNGQVKSAAQLTTDEAFRLSVFYDFYMPFRDSKNTVHLQNATFADKATHFLQEYRLDQITMRINEKGSGRQSKKLSDVVNDMITFEVYKDSTEKEAAEERRKTAETFFLYTMWDVRKAKMDKIAERLVAMYSKMLNQQFANLEAVNSHLLENDYTAETLQELAKKVGVSLIENGDYEVNKKRGAVQLNDTMMEHYRATRDLEIFKKRIASYKADFTKKLAGKSVFVMEDPGLKEKVKDMDPKFYNPVTKRLQYVAADGELNPILNAFFYTNIFLNNEFNSIILGEVWQHPCKSSAKLIPDEKIELIKTHINDNPNATDNREWRGRYGYAIAKLTEDKNEFTSAELDAVAESAKIEDYSDYMVREDYIKAREASRLIAQIKRTVIPGATIHPFQQNVLADKTHASKYISVGANLSMPKIMKVSVMSDHQAATWNISGQSKNNNDAWDGSGMSSPLTAALERYSMLDAGKDIGTSNKTIGADVDPITGKPTLLKWACYEITNEVRRNGRNSDINMEGVFKQMHNIPINIDPSKLLELVQKKFRVIAEANGGHLYARNLDGTIRELSLPTGPITTLYDIDQAFGGAYSCNAEGEFTSNNIDAMVALACENSVIKTAHINYIVNQSAIKVGQQAVNDIKAWQGNEKLSYFTMSSEYMGTQMNAEHELEFSHVTEMTQMISALIEDGNYPELIEECYEIIGKTVTDQLEAEGLLQNLAQGNRLEVERIIARLFVDNFSRNDRDTLGLAQSFLKDAAEKLKIKGARINIPYSDSNIYDVMISTVVSTMNRKGIRHKFEGFAGVLNPSRGAIQYYEFGGQKMLATQFVEKIYQLGLTEELTNHLINDRPAAIRTYIAGLDPNSEEFKELLDKKLIEEITSDYIDFEDTILKNGICQKVDDLPIYDSLKADSTAKVYRLNFLPKDLKGADTTFDIATHSQDRIRHFSINEVNSVRSSHFMTDMKNITIEKIVYITNTLNSVLTRTEHSTYIPENVKLAIEQLSALIVNDSFTDEAFKEAKAILKKNSVDIMHVLTDHTQAFCHILEDIKDGSARELDMNTYFNINEGISVIHNYKFHPPQCIMGRYNAKKYGLGKNDHLHEILKDEKFFENKLIEKYKIEEKDKALNSDFILWNGDTRYYVYGRTPNTDDVYTIDPDKIWVDGKWKSRSTEEVLVNDPDGPSMVWAIDSEGNHKVFIGGENKVEITKSLIRNPFFDKYIEHSGLNINGNYKYVIDVLSRTEDGMPVIRIGKNVVSTRLINETLDLNQGLKIFDKQINQIKKQFDGFNKNFISHLAKVRKASFEKQLICTGTRIPSQGMQSFMAMEIIAYTDVEDNQVYVPAAQAWLQGSDYDIDKVYILMHSISANGALLTDTDLSDELIGDFSSLPAPNNNISFTIGGEDPYVISRDEILKDATTSISLDGQDMINLLEKILRSGKTSIVMDPSIPNNISKDLSREIKRLLNIHNCSKRDNAAKTDVLRNKIVSAINKSNAAPLNQKSAQMPIAMDEQQAAGKKSPLKEDENIVSHDNPLSILIMQEQNMVGKQVIGITAVGLKGFFGLTFYYSKKIRESLARIEKAYNDGDINTVHSELVKIGEMPLNNLNYEKVIDFLEKTGYNDLNTLSVLKLSKPYPANSVLEWFKIHSWERHKNDSTLALSGLLSAATDNAKELILSKIKATPELADIYLHLLGIGWSFDSIAELMMSKGFQAAERLADKSIFSEFTKYFDSKKAVSWLLGELPGFLKQPDGWAALALSLGVNKKSEVKKKLGFEPGIIDEIINSLENGQDVSEKLNEIEKSINEGLANCTTALEKHSKGAYAALNDDEATDYDESAGIDDIDDLDENNSNDIIDTKSLGADKKIYWKYLEAYKVLEWCQKRIIELKNLEYKDFDSLKKIEKSLISVEETSLIGQTYGINQGMKTNTKDFYKFKLKVERFINKHFHTYREWRDSKDFLEQVAKTCEDQSAIDAYNNFIKTMSEDSWRLIDAINPSAQEVTQQKNLREEYQKVLKKLGIRFDFVKFCRGLDPTQGSYKDVEYKNMWIERYGRMVASHPDVFHHNVLEVFDTVPHYKAMLALYGTTDKLFRGISLKYNLLTDIADKLRNFKRVNLSDSDWKSLNKWVNEMIVMHFITSSDFDFKLKVQQKYGEDSSPEYVKAGWYNNSGRWETSSRESYDIKNINGLKTFKHLMDTVIIPHLKKQYSDNSDHKNPFIQDLCPFIDDSNPLEIKGFTLPLDMLNIDRSPEASNRYEEYLKGFNAIANIKLDDLLESEGIDIFNDNGSITIGEAFFLYNLLLHKNEFNDNSFSRIFEDTLGKNSSANSLIRKYFDHVAALDANPNAKDEFLLPPDAPYNKRQSELEGILDYLNTFSPTSNAPAQTHVHSLHTYRNDLFGYINFYLNKTKFTIGNTLNEKTYQSDFANLSDDDLLKAVVNRMNASHDNIVKIIDDPKDEILEKVDNAKISKAFVYNGTIYINTTLPTTTSDRIAALYHEMTHLILGQIKIAEKQENNAYYILMDKVAEMLNDPQNADILKYYTEQYKDLIGNDFLEEVFCGELEKLLADGKINAASLGEILCSNNGITIILNSINAIFGNEVNSKYQAPTLTEARTGFITNFPLNSEQIDVLAKVKEWYGQYYTEEGSKENVFTITGPASSGKTLLKECIKENLKASEHGIEIAEGITKKVPNIYLLVNPDQDTLNAVLEKASKYDPAIPVIIFREPMEGETSMLTQTYEGPTFPDVLTGFSNQYHLHNESNMEGYRNQVKSLNDLMGLTSFTELVLRFGQSFSGGLKDVYKASENSIIQGETESAVKQLLANNENLEIECN